MQSCTCCTSCTCCETGCLGSAANSRDTPLPAFTMTIQNETYSVSEAAVKCGIHRVTMWRWIKSGKLTAFRTPSGLYRIKKSDMTRFIKNEMPFLQTEDGAGPHRVLIVDDDPSIRRYLRRALSAYDVDVEEAGNGFDAGMKINNFNPDLILLDLFLPGIDGFEICRQIKSDPRYEHIKVVAITGMGTPEVEKRIRGLNVDHYMEKPIQLKALRHLVAPHFRPKTAAEGIQKNGEKPG